MKTLLASILSMTAIIATSSAMAVTTNTSATPTINTSQPSFDVEIALGNAVTNVWENYQLTNSYGVSTSGSNANGGFTYRGEVGYHLTQHFSIEAGMGALPTSHYTVTDGSTPYTIKSLYTYGAGRVDTQLTKKISLFAKAGITYRTYNTDDGTNSTSDHYWGSIMGAGTTLHINPHLYTSAEYDVIPGSTDSRQDELITAAHLFLWKVGYAFSA